MGTNEPTESTKATIDLFGVAGKSAVVTGGSRGIGYMIAEGLVRAGARVYISSRKAEDLAVAADSLAELGDCVGIPADLSTPEGIRALSDGVRAHESSLDVLVNNAGATWGEPLESFSEEAFDKVMNINVKGLFYVTTAFLPLLREAASEEDPARIINISSANGIAPPEPGSNNWPYAASKAAVNMLTRQLAGDLASDQITVNAIAPGPFESRMMDFIFDDPNMTEILHAYIPMKRHGRPSDMAGSVIFLSSHAGAFLTGTVIPVDGGLSTT